MARKRLNKKVALIGSAVLLLLVLVAVAAILYMSRDPQKFIEDGDAAWLAKDYEQAERFYLEALSSAKEDTLKVEILYKLADLYMQIDNWPRVRGCWEQIVNIDPENIKARLARLKYLYIAADTQANVVGVTSAVWKETQSQASELIELAQAAGLLMKDRAKWDISFGPEEKDSQHALSGLLGPYLYLVRGRVAFELARMGAVTAPEELLGKAMDDLERVLELEPNNVDAHWYLAQAAIEKGEILATRGDFGQRSEAAEKADELLEHAVEVAPAEPRSHIYRLTRKFNLARRGDRGQARQQLGALEPEYLSLAKRFPSNPAVFATLSMFYSAYSTYLDAREGLENVGKAIEAADKATEMAPEGVEYLLNAASLYYRKFSVYRQKPAVQKAVALAQKGLSLLDVRDTAGPRRNANRMNRFLLCSLLGNCYVDQILESRGRVSEADVEVLLTNLEQVVNEIRQILGTGEDPQVVKWQGMLELAKGNTNLAVRKLYAAYEQIKAAKARQQGDAPLCYTLAKIFKDTSEVGAAMEFLVGALQAGIEWTQPQATLDYLEVLGKLDMWSHVLSEANPYNVDALEQYHGQSPSSRRLRIEALIGTNQLAEAEERLAAFDPEDPQTIKLKLELVEAKIKGVRIAIAQKQAGEESDTIFKQATAGQEKDVEPDTSVKLMTAELDSHKQRRAQLVRALLLKDPSAVEQTTVIAVCKNRIEQGLTSEAKDLVNLFLKHFPESTDARFYRQLLAESDPANVPEQRRRQIEHQVLLSISDPVRKAVELGAFYRRNDEQAKAVEMFKEVLAAPETEPSHAGGPDRPYSQRTEQTDPARLAADHLFGIAGQTKDWELAEQVVETARRRNLDDCQGELFAARLAFARAEYKDALIRIDECLRQKPISSRVYLFRSNINTALENEHAAIEDARKAASLNPLDGGIARGLANALYVRNQKLGTDVSSDQILEARHAVERAVRLNPSDLALLSAYAEYISPTEPLKALAIRQALQRNAQSLQNAILLGRLATDMALKETDAARKQALFEIASAAFEQARSIDAHDTVLLENYAAYYRAKGENEKAKQLLLESEGQQLLWRHYYQLGQFDEAERVLQELYKRDPKDIDVVKGLFLVAERNTNAEAVETYSEQLLSLEENAQNRLDQVKAFLRVGLVNEAVYKLQSFKEKYPDEPKALPVEAWLAMRQGQLSKALELTNRSLEIDQDDAGAWRLRGEISLLMGNHEQATIDLNKSKSLSPSPITRIALARAYLQTGRQDDAITELKNAIDQPGAPPEARTMLEQTYSRLGREEALKRFYDDTLKKFPNSAMWHNRAATFAMARGEFDRAEQLYRKIYESKREDYLVENPKGGMQDIQYAIAFDGYLQALVSGAGMPNASDGSWHPEKLQKVFEESSKYENTAFGAMAYYRMAQAKLKLGGREQAIEYCRKAVDKAEKNERVAAEILLRMYLLLGAEEVSSYCQQRLQTDPDSMAANFTMFNLAKIQGEYNNAIGYIDRCIELTGPDTPQGLSYIAKKAQVLTLAYEKTSDNSYVKKAIANYESLLAKMPNDSSVLNNLAYMLAENDERLSEALEYAKRAVEQKPNNPSFLDTYAYVLCKTGRTSKAAEFLTSALQQYEQNEISAPSAVYEHLGMIREELGEKDKALAAYKQALEIGADRVSEAVKSRIESAIERVSP